MLAVAASILALLAFMILTGFSGQAPRGRDLRPQIRVSHLEALEIRSIDELLVTLAEGGVTVDPWLQEVMRKTHKALEEGEGVGKEQDQFVRGLQLKFKNPAESTE